jgi:hypothetical protein
MEPTLLSGGALGQWWCGGLGRPSAAPPLRRQRQSAVGGSGRAGGWRPCGSQRVGGGAAVGGTVGGGGAAGRPVGGGVWCDSRVRVACG